MNKGKLLHHNLGSIGMFEADGGKMRYATFLIGNLEGAGCRISSNRKSGAIMLTSVAFDSEDTGLSSQVADWR